jgi:hypothetical protein
MSDAFTAIVVCIAAVGATPDLVQCPHSVALDDGGYSAGGHGFTLRQCVDRLAHLHLPGDTFKFCMTSPVFKAQIDGFRREISSSVTH